MSAPRPSPKATGLACGRARSKHPGSGGHASLPTPPTKENRAGSALHPRRRLASVTSFTSWVQRADRPFAGAGSAVESRKGAVAWAIRHRSVSPPRSSNRTCRFPASGFPTGFIAQPASCPAKTLVSDQSNRQFSGWILPPPDTRAIGAHRKIVLFQRSVVSRSIRDRVCPAAAGNAALDDARPAA